MNDFVISGMISLEDVDNLAPQKLQDLRNCFDHLDTDKNERITVPEFKYGLTKLHIFIDSEEIHELIKEYDTDGDNSLDFEEFVQLVARLDPCTGQEIEINKAFKLFDKDQDGFITRSEVTEALTRFGISASEADVELLFAMTDDDNDGLINHAEFRNILYDAPTEVEPPLELRSPPSSPVFSSSSPVLSGRSPNFSRRSPVFPSSSPVFSRRSPKFF